MATMLTDPPTMAAAPQLALPPDEEAREIAVDSFIYGYPMVLMEIGGRCWTRQ